MQILQITKLLVFTTAATTTAQFIHSAPWRTDLSGAGTKARLTIRADEQECTTYPCWTSKPILFPPKPLAVAVVSKLKRQEQQQSSPPADYTLSPADIENMSVTNGQWRIGEFVFKDTDVCVALEGEGDSGINHHACMAQADLAKNYNGIGKLRKRRIAYMAGLIVVCILLAIVILAFLLFCLKRRKEETHPADVAQRELEQAERTLREAQEKDPNSRKTKKAEKKFRELQARTQVAPPASSVPTAV